jgi:cytochrome c oxidase assembly protein subunit 15
MSSVSSSEPVNAPDQAPPSGTVTVFRLAAVFAFLAVTIGGVVCATGSGTGCETWPGCRRSTITPQWQLEPVIEFTHRVSAFGSGPLILAAALMSLRLHTPDRWVRVLPWVALAGAFAAGAFGRLAVLSGISTWEGAIDLTCALTAMTVMGVAAVRVAPRPGVPGVPAVPGLPAAPAEGELTAFRVSRRQAVQAWQLAVAAVVVLIGMQVLGLFTAGKGSFTRCMGWPLWRIVETDRSAALQWLRLGVAVVGAGLVVATAVTAARHERLRSWGIGIGVLFAAEMLIGLQLRGGGFGIWIAAAYSVTASVLLCSLGLLIAVARVERVGIAEHRELVHRA